MNELEYQKIRLQQDVHWWFVAKREIVLSLWKNLCDIPEEANVLDAGCGMGFLMGYLQKYTKNVYGFDMSEEAVSFCQSKYGKENVKKGLLPDSIPFEDGYFNSIFALDVFEHIDDDVAAMKSIYQKLDRGGVPGRNSTCVNETMELQ